MIDHFQLVTPQLISSHHLLRHMRIFHKSYQQKETVIIAVKYSNLYFYSFIVTISALHHYEVENHNMKESNRKHLKQKS